MGHAVECRREVTLKCRLAIPQSAVLGVIRRDDQSGWIDQVEGDRTGAGQRLVESVGERTCLR